MGEWCAKQFGFLLWNDCNGTKSLLHIDRALRDFLQIKVRATTELWTTGHLPFGSIVELLRAGRMGVRPNRNISLVVAIWGTIVFVFFAGGSLTKMDALIIRRKNEIPCRLIDGTATTLSTRVDSASGYCGWGVHHAATWTTIKGDVAQ